MAKKSQRRKQPKRSTSRKRKGRSKPIPEHIPAEQRAKNLRRIHGPITQRGPTAPPNNQCGPYDDEGRLGRGSMATAPPSESLPVATFQKPYRTGGDSIPMHYTSRP